MVGIPDRYAVPSAVPAIQYSWQEFGSNVGYIRFYACRGTTAGTVYFLTTQVLDSKSPFQSGNGTYNYLFLVNKSMTVSNDYAYVNFSRTPNNAGTSVAIRVYHSDPVHGETLIGTGATAGGVAALPERDCVRVLLTKKKFEKGISIKIAVDCGACNVNHRYYDDPGSGLALVDGFVRTIGTDFTFDVPFVVTI